MSPNPQRQSAEIIEITALHLHSYQLFDRKLSGQPFYRLFANSSIIS